MFSSILTADGELCWNDDRQSNEDRHYVNDVIPFLRAISLDGNPGIYNDRYVPTNLTRPCLYQGQNLNDYISRRPTLPTGTTP